MSGRHGVERLFLIWMYAPRHPMWSMPRPSVEAIREALGEGWKVRFLEEPLHATGDGARETPPALLEAIRDAEVFCGFGIAREAFRAARRLRWVHSGAAGVGGALFPEMRASDVVLTNSTGMHAEPMAEHALAMILHFARGLDVAVRGQARRRWRHTALTGPESPVVELAGRVTGVVGYGSIGSAVARRARALGMRVRAIRRNPGALPEDLERLDGPDELGELLEASHYVVLTVPETEATRGLLGRRELDRMRPDAVLVNLARGGVVDEEALLEALMERRLRGAALDVFRQEPLPEDSPLWELDNVLLTPHTGGVTPRFWERETELIVENIRRYLEGRDLTNRVDKEAGY